MHNEKIKILHIINHMNDGGAQRIVLNYLKDFNCDNDIELKVLVYKDKTNSYCNRIIEENGYDVDYLFKNIHNKYIRKIIELIFGKIILTNYIKKYQPNIVHVHIYSFLVKCLKPIIKCKIPIRFDTLHSNPYRNTGKSLKYIKQAFQQEKFIGICLTNEQANQAKEYYGMEKYEIVRNGIDIQKIKKEMIPKFDAKIKFGLKDSDFVVGAVGRLNVIKRYDVLLEIFKKILNINKNAILLIAGDGPERNKLKDLSKKLKIENKVKFLGNIDNTTELYCAMDVFVMTSKTEASPLVLIESQVCGVRSVISDGVPSESIVTNKVKKMSKTASLEDWSEAILEVDFEGHHSLDFNDYEVHKSSKRMKEVYLKYWNEYKDSINTRNSKK